MKHSQQEYLHEAMQELDLTREQFAERIGVPWDTFRRWLMMPSAKGKREMAPAAWSLVREVLEHERLKTKYEKLKKKAPRKS